MKWKLKFRAAAPGLVPYDRGAKLSVEVKAETEKEKTHPWENGCASFLVPAVRAQAARPD